MADALRSKRLTAGFAQQVDYSKLHPGPQEAIAVIMDRDFTPSQHSQQSSYYLELASAIRARLPTLQDEEVINELYLLATHYERLAEFADSLGSLKGLSWPDISARPTPGRRGHTQV